MELFENCDQKILKQWYIYGLMNGTDCFIKFMMHWVAFNWEYSQCGEPGSKEREKITDCISRNYNKLCHYNPFASPDVIRPFRKTVLDCRNRREDFYRKSIRDTIKNDKAPMIDRMTALFLAMYQVRCNLFHGSKSLDDTRDRELVEKSSIILEGYLKALFTDSQKISEECEQLRAALENSLFSEPVKEFIYSLFFNSQTYQEITYWILHNQNSDDDTAVCSALDIYHSYKNDSMSLKI